VAKKKQQQTKSKQSNSKGQKGSDSKNSSDAWIPMRTGLIIVTAFSLGMAALTAWTAIPAKGWLEGIFWGLVFGGGVWLVFMIALLFNRFVRGKRY